MEVMVNTTAVSAIPIGTNGTFPRAMLFLISVSGGSDQQCTSVGDLGFCTACNSSLVDENIHKMLLQKVVDLNTEWRCFVRSFPNLEVRLQKK